VDGYYNFIGHYTSFKDSQVDALVDKAVKLDSFDLVLDILKNHNYLMYYPATPTLENATRHIRATGNVEHAKELL
jgi:hypothetical protein